MTPTIVFIVLAKKIHKIINNIKFMEKHRMHKHDFTRKGKIGFAELCILILKCSKRGIHAGLIEFMKEFKKVDTYSDSAFCQARKKSNMRLSKKSQWSLQMDSIRKPITKLMENIVYGL